MSEAGELGDRSTGPVVKRERVRWLSPEGERKSKKGEQTTQRTRAWRRSKTILKVMVGGFPGKAASGGAKKGGPSLGKKILPNSGGKKKLSYCRYGRDKLLGVTFAP